MVGIRSYMICVAFAVVFLAWDAETFAADGNGVVNIVSHVDIAPYLGGASASPSFLPMYRLNIRQAIAERVEINAIDANFAPSTENLDITYTILPAGAIAVSTKLEVLHPENGTVIYTEMLGVRSGTVTDSWNGKDASTAYVLPTNKTYKVKISICSGTDWSKASTAIAETKVEVASIDFSPATLSKLIKPSRTAKEIKQEAIATVKVKNKAGKGVITAIPIPVYWSYIDIDDDSNVPGIDLNGSAGDDNVDSAHNGKRTPGASGAALPMWEQTAGWQFHLVNEDRSISWTSTSGAEMGKAKVTFLSSVVGGDNYEVHAEAYNHGSGVDPMAFGNWTVWKKMEFQNVYQMADVKDFGGFTWRAAQVNALGVLAYVPGAFDGDGCYEIKVPNAVQELNGKEFLVWFDKPLKSEEVTPSELADFNLPTTDPLHVKAKSAITAKAKLWFDRNICEQVDKFVSDNHLVTPCIVGAIKLSTFHDNQTIPVQLFDEMYRPIHPTSPSAYISIKEYYGIGVVPTAWTAHSEILGIESGGAAFVFNNGSKSSSDAGWIGKVKHTARHEVGHATDHVTFGSVLDAMPFGNS